MIRRGARSNQKQSELLVSFRLPSHCDGFNGSFAPIVWQKVGFQMKFDGTQKLAREKQKRDTASSVAPPIKMRCAACAARYLVRYPHEDRCSYILILFRFVRYNSQAQISLLPPKRQRLHKSTAIPSPVDRRIGDGGDTACTGN